MKKEKIIIALFVACLFLFSCENHTTNNSNLEEVKIGTQTWSTKNLDVSIFRNGDTIPEAKTNDEWKKAGDEKRPAWCYYNNDPSKGKKYGKLYNWYAVNDPVGLAPKGWHIPSDTEWTILTDYLGGEDVAGTKMKSTSGWNDHEGKTGNGTNTNGFAGSPSGYRNEGGIFNNVGNFGGWWSSSESSTTSAWDRGLGFDVGNVGRGNDGKSLWLSVRCMRD